MNKEYICLKGNDKCVVEDENGNKRIENYTDNIEEILIQENIIETMQDELEETIEEIPEYESRVKGIKKSVLIDMAEIIGIPLFLYIFITSLLGDLSQVPFATVNSIFYEWFGPVSTGHVLAALMTTISAMLTSMVMLGEYRFYKTDSKRLRGLIVKKEVLEKDLKRAKEKLKELKEKQQTETLSPQIMIKKVDDLKYLKLLREYLNLYYSCGYNHKKYIKYYKNGKLHKKLEKYYYEPEIELVEQYIEENEPGIKRTLKK